MDHVSPAASALSLVANINMTPLEADAGHSQQTELTRPAIPDSMTHRTAFLRERGSGAVKKVELTRWNA